MYKSNNSLIGLIIVPIHFLFFDKYVSIFEIFLVKKLLDTFKF